MTNLDTMMYGSFLVSGILLLVLIMMAWEMYQESKKFRIVRKHGLPNKPRFEVVK